jgi:alkylhydroperoxidase/carboxymuconolactone decarboxylase family protein YurZ
MPRRERSDTDKGRAEALIARMKKARGYIYPEWEFAARQDPEFVETYNKIYELGLGEGRHVSAKVREFVAIALLAFRGSDRAGLVAHMERAIRFGATREELFEVLETCLVPGGAPTFHRGLGALLEVKTKGK